MLVRFVIDKEWTVRFLFPCLVKLIQEIDQELQQMGLGEKEIVVLIYVKLLREEKI